VKVTILSGLICANEFGAVSELPLNTLQQHQALDSSFRPADPILAAILHLVGFLTYCKMCNLCRKVETLGGYDYKVIKPVFLAVSKLHKHVEPRLGNLWLLRHDETARLRKLLGGLHKVVPVAALTEIINEVDNELDHVKQQMSEHPLRHSIRRREELKSSIAPSESPSVRIYRKKKFEPKKGSHHGTKKVCVSPSMSPPTCPQVRKKLGPILHPS